MPPTPPPPPPPPEPQFYHSSDLRLPVDERNHSHHHHHEPPANFRSRWPSGGRGGFDGDSPSSSLSAASLGAKLIANSSKADSKAPQHLHKHHISNKPNHHHHQKLELSRNIALPVGLVEHASASKLSALGLPRQRYTSNNHHHQQQQTAITTQPELNYLRSDGYFAPTAECQTTTKLSTPTNDFGINKQHHYPAHQESLVLIKFCSMVYAMFLIILGCVLHVLELKKKSRNSPDHIYSSVVALFGFLWLTFLHVDLQRYKRVACKHLDFDPSHMSSAASSSSLSASRSSSVLERYFDRLSLSSSEVLFKRSARLERHLHELAKSLPDKAAKHAHLNVAAKTSLNAAAASASASGSKPPDYRFERGKTSASFYLKCGMAAFCFGHVVHEGLRFGQQLYFFFTDNVPCQDAPALVAHLVTPLYSFYQLFMMFKYSNLVINRHRGLAYFGLMHVIGTSIAFWFRTIIEEAFDDFVSKMNYLKTPDYVRHRKQLLNSTTLLDKSLINSSNLTLSNARRFSIADDSLRLAHDPLEPSEPDGGTRAEDPLSESSSSAATPLLQSQSNISTNMISLVAPHMSVIGPQAASTVPDFYACSQNSLLTTKSLNALPYLYPFTIEYNLLIAATFLGLYFNVGKITNTGGYNGYLRALGSGSSLALASTSSSSPSAATSSSGGSSANASGSSSSHLDSHQHHPYQLTHNHYYNDEFKSNFVVSADCHAANRGLFAGFFTLLVAMVSIVIFFVSIGKAEHVELGIKINLIQETTLTILILLVVIFGSIQTRRLNRNPCMTDTITTNDVLILVPLPFFFAHSLLSIRAEYHTVNVPLNQISTFKWLAIMINLVSVIEVLAQTIFIIDGLRRCSQTKYLRFKKPGRELLTFCLILNITFWIVATFESKSVEQYHVEIDYYGPLSWQFVSHTTLPVMLFYRYHSSVCLAEIWNRAYKPAKALTPPSSLEI